MNTIRTERQRQGLTQVALAVRAGVSPMTLRRAEHFGANVVTQESLRKIAAALGCKPADLLVRNIGRRRPGC